MQFKNNTKQRNVSIQGLRSFKDTLPKNVKRIINKKGHIYSETLSNWKYLVGDELFKCCYPKKFKSSNKFGNGKKLENYEINSLPKYLQNNSQKYKEWID